jgi:hypothetical protein
MHVEVMPGFQYLPCSLFSGYCDVSCSTTPFPPRWKETSKIMSKINLSSFIVLSGILVTETIQLMPRIGIGEVESLL